MADTLDAPAALHDAEIDAPAPDSAPAAVPQPGPALSSTTDDLSAAQRPRPALSFSSRAMTAPAAAGRSSSLSTTVEATQRRLAEAICTT